MLLLLRAGSHNAGTWGLPGGNRDATDPDLLATALREAGEEMGGTPEHSVRAELLTVRGKRGQKHYTVFVAAVPPAARAAFTPALNEEHSAWRWAPLAEAVGRGDLHPVVDRVLNRQPHQATVLGIAAAGRSGGGSGGGG